MKYCSEANNCFEVKYCSEASHCVEVKYCFEASHCVEVKYCFEAMGSESPSDGWSRLWSRYSPLLDQLRMRSLDQSQITYVVSQVSQCARFTYYRRSEVR